MCAYVCAYVRGVAKFTPSCLVHVGTVHKPAVHSMQKQEVLNGPHSMVQVFNHELSDFVAKYRVDSEHF